MLFPLKFYPDPVLRKKLKACSFKKDKKFIDTLVPTMMETMEYMNGAGLAANQLGFNMRLAVINPAADERYKGEKPYAIINPKILKASEEVEMEEGCLSCPVQESESIKEARKEARKKDEDYNNPLQVVKRFNKVKVTYTDINGKKVTKTVDGKLAQIFQHELGHLDGKLYIDLLSPMKRSMIEGKIKKGVRRMTAPGVKRSKFKNHKSTQVPRNYG